MPTSRLNKLEHLVENERLCQLCYLNAVESEVYVLMHCNQYTVLRQPLLDMLLNDTDNLCFVLIDPNKRQHHCFIFIILSNY